MCSDKSLKRFRPHQRRITRQNDSKFRSTQSAARDLHRMACAVLRLLQYRLGAKGLNHRRYLLRLMSYDDYRLFCAQRRARAYDVFDQRASPRAVQNLCKT